jgi:minor histocompatibility antigen H13
MAAVAKQTNPLLVGSYLVLVVLWGVSQVIYIPFVAHLLIVVTAILYAACHQSLILLQKEETDENGESQHSSASSDRETLKAEDAYQFPLMGSISLFSLYLAFKFLDKDLVNLLIGAYFGLVGCFAVGMTVAPAVMKVTPKSFHKEHKINLPMDNSFEFNLADLIALAGAAAVCGFYFFNGKPWYLNNILGVSFCLQGIERFSLGTYKIGAILLVGLFFYDIFWVFGTEVMVTVAKSLDGPIKLLFPRDGLDVDEETGKLSLSLLGLGDIVIPGFFLSLLLRFDAHRAQISTKDLDIHASFPKPYFTSCLIAYVIGLATTLFVMFYFEAAQPALLYLVPACLLSSFICALARGEVKELLDYSEEEEEGSVDIAKAAEAKKDD